jgi:hypothetical protein
MKFRHGLFVNVVYAEALLDVIIQGVGAIHVAGVKSEALSIIIPSLFNTVTE